MQCTKCGKELPADAAFCFACGAPLAHRPDAPPLPARDPVAASSYLEGSIEAMRTLYGKEPGAIDDATFSRANRALWEPTMRPDKRVSSASDIFAEDVWSARSAKLAVVVTALLALGVTLLFTMPVMTASSTQTDFVTGNTVTTHDNARYGVVEAAMNLAGGEWAVVFLWVGLVTAVGGAVVLPNTQQQLRSFVVTAGSVAMMAFPFWVSTHQKIMGASIGSGTVLAWIVFVVAALAAWVL